MEWLTIVVTLKEIFDLAMPNQYWLPSWHQGNMKLDLGFGIKYRIILLCIKQQVYTPKAWLKLYDDAWWAKILAYNPSIWF